jgi:hypothetical protein
MKRKFLIALIGLFAVAALNVLSVGPVVLVYQKARLWQTSPDLTNVLRILYSPLEVSPITSKPASWGRIKTSHFEVLHSYQFS